MMSEKNIAEKSNTVLSSDQISAASKAIFINWLLNYARAYPEKFPERQGRVIYQKMGDPATVVAVLSKEEILSWHNTNRPDNTMTTEEVDAIIDLQKRNGLVIVDNCYYTLLI